MGDYYNDPNLPADQVNYYAVVDIDLAQSLSQDIPHELIAQLVLAPNSSYLVHKAQA